MQRVFIRLQWIVVACLFLLLGAGVAALWIWLWTFYRDWARTFAIAFVFVVALCAGTLVASVLLALSTKSRPLCGEDDADTEHKPLMHVQRD